MESSFYECLWFRPNAILGDFNFIQIILILVSTAIWIHFILLLFCLKESCKFLGAYKLMPRLHSSIAIVWTGAVI